MNEAPLRDLARRQQLLLEYSAALRAHPEVPAVLVVLFLVLRPR